MNLLFGVLISALVQVNEVEPFSNAVSFIPENEAQVTDYLNEVDNRMVPVIIINQFFQDQDGRFIYKESPNLRYALSQSSHFGRIVFMWDEIMMHGRAAGQNKEELIQVMQQVKADYPGVEFAHIEAYRELFAQYMEDYGKLTLFFDADHLGFDCYGPFDGCGDETTPAIPQIIYLAVIHNAIEQNNSNAKIFLVPGAFKHDNHFPTEMDTINQLQEYVAVLNQNREHVSGIGLFTWGDIQHITGARSNADLASYVETMLSTIKYEHSYNLAQ